MTKAAKVYDYDTERIPLVGNHTNRFAAATKDQIFYNVIPESIENPPHCGLLDVHFINTLPVLAPSRHSREACPVLDTGAGILLIAPPGFPIKLGMTIFGQPLSAYLSTQGRISSL